MKIVSRESIRTTNTTALFDPAALMRIKNLELRARLVVEGFWKGIHRSPYHGFSVEFSEYRQYVAGDDTRYLDWKLLARSNRPYIKKFEEETNVRAHLLVDTSPSMAFSSVSYTKLDYTRTLAATLAYFLHLQGDAVGLLTFAETIGEALPARNRIGHLRRIVLALEKTAPAPVTTNLAAPLEHITGVLRGRGLIFLITDLLAPIETLEKRLGAITACGHEVFLFHILDPAEITFDFNDAAVFFELESGRELFIEPSAVRAEYLRKLEAHNAAARSICERLGILYHHFSTARPLELALWDVLQEQMKC